MPVVPVRVCSRATRWAVVSPPDSPWGAMMRHAGERVTGVAAWGASMAMVMTQGPGKESGGVDGRLVTSKALQFEPAGGPSEGWFSVWPGP